VPILVVDHLKKVKNKMAKFNYKKWVTENKYGKLSEMKYDDPFDQEEEDPKNPMGLPEVEKDSKAVDVTSYDDDPDSDLAYAQRHGMTNTMEVEKDPDAQAAAPKKGGEGEGEKEKKPPLDPTSIVGSTSFGDLSGIEDAKNVLQQILTKDPNQPIFKAMEFTPKDKESGKPLPTVKPDPEKIAAWVKSKGVDTLANRMMTIAGALPSTGLEKKDMPFLPGPDDAVGDPADVGDALSPGGKYNVDFKQEAIDPPATNKLKGPDDPAAQAYMKSGEKDGNANDDKAGFELKPSIPASEAEPTQVNIKLAKSLAMGSDPSLSKGGDLGAYFSTEGEILDGHHRWAATMLNDPGANIGGFAAIDLKAMGGRTKALKHLTAIGNALGNQAKTNESIDPRASLYEQLENHINKNLNEMDNYYVDYYVVYDKKTDEEIERFQKPPNNMGLEKAERYIQRMESDPYWDVEVGQYGIRLDTESHSMEE